MYRLLTVVLLVAGCGGAVTSPIIASPVATSIPTATAAAVSATPASTSSAGGEAVPIDPKLVSSFKAAVLRLKDLPTASDADWPATQVLLRDQADIYDAFARDLEAIPFPERVIQSGESRGLGRDAAALVTWSKEMARVRRQVAEAESFDAAMKDTIEFAGTSYQVQSFIQDAIGEWQASLSLTAGDLGVDLSKM